MTGFSFFGDDSGPPAEFVRYDVGTDGDALWAWMTVAAQMRAAIWFSSKTSAASA